MKKENKTEAQKTKKADPATETASQNVQANDTPLPVKLPPEITQKLLNQLSERANQARRLVINLSENPDSPTGHLNRDSGVNLSNVAIKYNPLIRPCGYYMACRIPPSPIINGHGEKSGQRLWGIYRINGGS